MNLDNFGWDLKCWLFDLQNNILPLWVGFFFFVLHKLNDLSINYKVIYELTDNENSCYLLS